MDKIKAIARVRPKIAASAVSLRAKMRRKLAVMRSVRKWMRFTV